MNKMTLHWNAVTTFYVSKQNEGWTGFITCGIFCSSDRSLHDDNFCARMDAVVGFIKVIITQSFLTGLVPVWYVVLCQLCSYSATVTCNIFLKFSQRLNFWFLHVQWLHVYSLSVCVIHLVRTICVPLKVTGVEGSHKPLSMTSLSP